MAFSHFESISCQNEVRCVAVTCYAKGEMMEEYIFIESGERHKLTMFLHLLHFYDEFTNYVNE